MLEGSCNRVSRIFSRKNPVSTGGRSTILISRERGHTKQGFRAQQQSLASEIIVANKYLLCNTFVGLRGISRSVLGGKTARTAVHDSEFDNLKNVPYTDTLKASGEFETVPRKRQIFDLSPLYCRFA